MIILLTVIKKFIHNKIEKIKSFFNEKVKYLICRRKGFF